MNRTTTAALFALATLATSVHAQSMKPGLWEHSHTMKSQSGQMEAAMAQMQQQLASMPPAQRKQMEQMLAAQGVGLGPKGQSVRVCVTPEQAARLDMPQQDKNCKQTITQRSGNSMKMSFSCAGDPPSQGEGEVTFKSDGAYEGRFWVQTRVNGKPERMDMTQSGKWISASCGNIAPIK